MIAHSNYILYAADVRVSHETKPSRLLCSFVLYNNTVFKSPESTKIFTELTLLQVVWEAANKYLSVLWVGQIIVAELVFNMLCLVIRRLRRSRIDIGAQVAVQYLRVSFDRAWLR